MLSRTPATLSRIRLRISSLDGIAVWYRTVLDLTSPQIRWYPCTMLTQTIGFIGAGQMARALAQGFTTASLVPGRQIIHCDPVESANHEFGERVSGAVEAASNAEVVSRANVIFLAVKPQNMPAVFVEIGGRVGAERLVVSIAAGVPLARLCEGLNTDRVVRVMPNTPAL